MNIRRRQFIGMVSSSIISLPRLGVSQDRRFDIRTFSILFTGLKAGQDARAIGAFLAEFMSKGIPFSIEVDIGLEDGGATAPDTDLLRLLDGLVTQYPATAELALCLDGLLEKTPYFQARALYDVRAFADQRLGHLPLDRSEFTRFQTISTGLSPNQTSAGGLRPGGCTVAIYDALDQADLNATLAPSMVMMLPRKSQLDLPEAADAFTAQLFAGLGSGTVVGIDIDALPDDAAEARGIGRSLAEAVNKSRLTAYLLPVLPSEEFRRCCSFLANHTRIFVFIDNAPASAVDWTALRAQASEIYGETCLDIVVPEGQFADGTWFVRRQDGTRLKLGNPGIDTEGAYVNGPVSWLDESKAFWHPDAVAVTRMPEEGAPRPAMPSAMNLCRGDAPPVPDIAFQLLDRSKSLPLEPPEPVTFDATDQADAELAFAYLTRFENATTGMCPATVKELPDAIIPHSELTMWDIGSLILGLLAARELDLIDEDTQVERILRIVDHVPNTKHDGHVVPAAIVSVDTGRMRRDGFDTCDFGRLSVALHFASQQPRLAEACAAKYAEWGVAGLIKDGALVTVTRRGTRSSYWSHCAHYLMRGLTLHGITGARSPYSEAFFGDTEADRLMNLLYAADSIGILSSEPLLMEAVELGASRESEHLIDVFFAALRHEETEYGRLLAPSETPLDAPPWFAYQGLDIGHDHRWSVSFLDSGRSRFEDITGSPHATFSSKAAYLWRAVRPGPFAGRLVEKVRDNGRIAGLGFASGLYLSDYKPLANLTDLNTNSVILQALAQRKKQAGAN
jgi:hypothetical protein